MHNRVLCSVTGSVRHCTLLSVIKPIYNWRRVALHLQHAEARCDLGTKTAALQESMEQLKLSTAHATALENDLAKLRGELADTAQSLEVSLSAPPLTSMIIMSCHIVQAD